MKSHNDLEVFMTVTNLSSEHHVQTTQCHTVVTISSLAHHMWPVRYLQPHPSASSLTNIANVHFSKMADPENLPDASEPTKPRTNSDPQPRSPTTKPSKSKKRKTSSSQTSTQQTHQFSLRSPPWCYIHMQHLSPSQPTTIQRASPLDPLTAHIHLTSALSSFLGLHGSAIQFDILKLEGQKIWIRVASEDRAAVVAAAGGWMSGSGEGWRVVGWSYWNAGVVGARGGRELFD